MPKPANLDRAPAGPRKALISRTWDRPATRSFCVGECPSSNLASPGPFGRGGGGRVFKLGRENGPIPNGSTFRRQPMLELHALDTAQVIDFDSRRADGSPSSGDPRAETDV